MDQLKSEAGERQLHLMKVGQQPKVITVSTGIKCWKCGEYIKEDIETRKFIHLCEEVIE